MKRILFLSFHYPFGEFGASTLCSTRIMRALCQSGEYEVHCLTYQDNNNPKYDNIPGIVLHSLEFTNKNRKFQKIKKALTLPLFPIYHPIQDFKHYKACKEFCKKEKFDIVIAQYFPETSLITGVLLKKYGYIDNLSVIFWDNMYGKLPRRIIPKNFAMYRQRKVENWVAKYADTLISLYPIRDFHQKYGDVPNAQEKRFYLGIPSIAPPIEPIDTPYLKLIDKNKINIVYSGTIINKGYIKYIVEVLNRTSMAKTINLIFFSQGMSTEEFDILKDNFCGTIHNVKYIPQIDLYSVYQQTDFFLSTTGYPQAIRSKCFEYLSYGRPLIHIYEYDCDVNVATFSKYPLSSFINIHNDIDRNIDNVNHFITQFRDTIIPYEDVKNIFSNDNAEAYIRLITQRISASIKSNK